MGGCCGIEALSRFHNLDTQQHECSVEIPSPSSTSHVVQAQVAELKREHQREMEALRQAQAQKEAEWTRSQRALQRRAEEATAQLRTAQHSLRLFQLRGDGEGTVGQYVQDARLVMLQKFTEVLRQVREQEQLREAFALWRLWLQRQQALALTVCDTRQDMQRRAVEALAATWQQSVRSAAYHRWREWALLRRHASLRHAVASAPRVLQVTVRRAVKLVVDSKFKFGNPDPYVCLIAGKTRIQTAVQKGTLNPVWEETHLVALEPKVLTFRVEVLDFEKRLTHNLIAAQDVLFGELPPNRTVELTLPLKVRHNHDWVDSTDSMLYLGLTPRGPGWT